MKIRDAYTLLFSLGVSFDRDIDGSLSPEEALIALVRDFNLVENRRLLSLAILAFQNLQSLFRPDLLGQLLKREDSLTVRIVGGIIFRNELKHNARWSRLRKQISSHRRTKVYFGNERLIELRGNDEGFASFGIYITPVVASGDKKLLALDWIISQNTWLKNRVLFGPSVRADVYTIRELFLESNPYQVSKRFNQSYPSINKVWNDIIHYQDLCFRFGGDSVLK